MDLEESHCLARESSGTPVIEKPIQNFYESRVQCAVKKKKRRKERKQARKKKMWADERMRLGACINLHNVIIFLSLSFSLASVRVCR